MKTFIVGCALLASVGVGWAGTWSLQESRESIRRNYSIAEDHAIKVPPLLTLTPLNIDSRIQKALFHVRNIRINADDINTTCEDLRSVVREWTACKDTYVDAVKLAAEGDLQIAEFAVATRQPDLAKKLYRSVVITYTGTAYVSYVKRAEFALEDLKGN